jgi:hypothetical protein
VYVASVTGTVLVLLPVLLRYPRTLMLYFFGDAGYDPQAARRARRGHGDEA